jgi:hypothetical protein
MPALATVDIATIYGLLLDGCWDFRDMNSVAIAQHSASWQIKNPPTWRMFMRVYNTP